MTKSRQQPSPQQWTTEDGRVLSPQEMDTDHLYNCMILMEQRAADKYVITIFSTYVSEHKQVLELLHDTGFEAFIPEIYYAMRAELRSRGEDFGQYDCEAESD